MEGHSALCPYPEVVSVRLPDASRGVSGSVFTITCLVHIGTLIKKGYVPYNYVEFVGVSAIREEAT